MFKQAKIFYIHTISPMHVGSGSDLGIVDLPIQREGHTGYPKIEGSSLKGSIREVFEANNASDLIKIHMIFGCDGCADEKKAPSAVIEAFKKKEDQEFAGALGFSDARILLFPIKSVKGVFAWITCPMVLKRFMQDLDIAENKQDFEINENSVTTNSKILIDKDSVILEEYQIPVSENEESTKIADFLAKELDNNEIKDKLVILSDEDFKDFVTLSTEVITRTKINNTTGTVLDGALFTEEYLPSESIMYSLALASPIMAPIDVVQDLKDEKDVLDFFTTNIPNIIQIGGNATIGKGLVAIKGIQNEN